MCHPLSMYAKFTEKLTFLTPIYARISGLEMLVFQKKIAYVVMDGPLHGTKLIAVFTIKPYLPKVFWCFQMV